MNRLYEIYTKEIRKSIQKELGVKNVLAVPKLSKIVINIGLGEAVTNPSAIDKMSEDLMMITGQKPIVTRAKKAISNFKIRPGASIGLKVTLRGQRMWDFFDKLISVVLPRVRDFRGLTRNAFDGNGNYSVGIREHTVFPEVDPNKIDKLRGIEVVIVTTAQNDNGGVLLLSKLGMPFVKETEETSLRKLQEQMKQEVGVKKGKKKEQSKRQEDT